MQNTGTNNLETNNLDKMFEKSKNTADFAKNYLAYLTQVISSLDTTAIGKFVDLVVDAREKGRQIFFIGNGGSAATASHFANDISIGTRTTRKPFKAMSLTDNVAILTALGNDEGYEYIFVKQLQNFANPNDVLVAISASGNSPNIIKALEFAKTNKMFIVGLSGFDGGKLKQMSDLAINVSTPKGEYGPVEDLHMVVDHLVGAYLCRLVKQTE